MVKILDDHSCSGYIYERNLEEQLDNKDSHFRTHVSLCMLSVLRYVSICVKCDRNMKMKVDKVQGAVQAVRCFCFR